VKTFTRIITSSLGGHARRRLRRSRPAQDLAHNDDKGISFARTSVRRPCPPSRTKFSQLESRQRFGSSSRPKHRWRLPDDGIAWVTRCGLRSAARHLHFLIDPTRTKLWTFEHRPAPRSPSFPLATDSFSCAACGTSSADSARGRSLRSHENRLPSIDEVRTSHPSRSLSPGNPSDQLLGHGTSACLQNPYGPCCTNFHRRRPGCPGYARSGVPEGCVDTPRNPANLAAPAESTLRSRLSAPVQRTSTLLQSTVTDRTQAMRIRLLDLQCKTVGCLRAETRIWSSSQGCRGAWRTSRSSNDLEGLLSAATFHRGVWPKIVGDPRPSGPSPRRVRT